VCELVLWLGGEILRHDGTQRGPKVIQFRLLYPPNIYTNRMGPLPLFWSWQNASTLCNWTGMKMSKALRGHSRRTEMVYDCHHHLHTSTNGSWMPLSDLSARNTLMPGSREEP
jgi:hypothetical protein